MNSTFNLVNSKTRKIQVQLFKTLFYQAVTPIATILVPVMFVIIPIILQMDVTLSVIIVTSEFTDLKGSL
uniref:Uncharacterized protein n=1 Tax=Acrobeloides nanus TaxID=290746 RepID=A0A914CJ70_9BILA